MVYQDHSAMGRWQRWTRLRSLVLAVTVGCLTCPPWCVPAAAAGPGPTTLSLVVGKANILDFPVNVVRASVSDPAIASVVIISPKELLLNGKAAGVTNLVVWDDQEHKQIFDVDVKADTSQLSALIREIAPTDSIEVYAADGSLVLTGEVGRPTTITQVQQLAVAFVGKDKEKVVNLLRLAEVPQVMLKVRFVEVNRTALQDLGIDIIAQGQRFFFVSQAGKAGAAFSNNKPWNATEPFPQNVLTPQNAQAFGLANVTNSGSTMFQALPEIKANQQKQLLRTLAEPNLLAKSGEEASFLAGGEIPIPMVTANTVQITYKEFGVRLNFKPEVTDSGSIQLNVEPEVSSVDFSNAVTASGFSIPGFRTRRTHTTVELRDGETLVIGGLLSQDMTKTASKVPMISDLPVLGDLFKSSKFNKGESELLVLVSPSLVRPNNLLPTKPLLADHTMGPFLEPGQPPYVDAQAGRMRNALGGSHGAIWEPDSEADPFLKRKSDVREQPAPSIGSTMPPTSWMDAPAGADPEYHETLQKYQLVNQDSDYSRTSRMLQERLSGRTGVADQPAEENPHGLYDVLGYRAHSW